MLNSNAMLDFAIGMISLFLMASLITTALQEGVAQILNKRAELLKATLQRILTDGKTDTGIDDFLKQPLISALKTRDGVAPSYIPRNVFVEAVKAFYLKTGPAPAAAAAFIQSAMALPSEGTLGQRVVRQAAEQAGASMESIDKAIGDWFDAVMDRVSGAYKRWTQIVVFLLGFGVAWAGNLDAIVVANHLANSPATRTQFAEKMAEAMGKASQPDKELQAKIERAACETRLPIGWGEPPSICKSADTALKPGSGSPDMDFGNALLKALGFLITALTTTIGAAFWFDLLKRFVNIRAAGPLRASADHIGSYPAALK